MFSRLKPKANVFFGLFTSSAQYLAAGARTLNELLDHPDFVTVAERMGGLEHECDSVTHELFRTLNSSFITPFDRSDIYLLGSSLDDVMDPMEAAAHLMLLYGIDELPPALKEMLHTLDSCARITAETMPRLSTLKNLDEYWVEINRLENVGDHTHRQFLAKLFDGSWDTLTVLKLKDIAEELEDAVDAFERVSHIIESIALKES